MCEFGNPHNIPTYSSIITNRGGSFSHPIFHKRIVSILPKLFSCFLLVVFLSFPSPSGQRVSVCPLKKEVFYAICPVSRSADQEAVGSAL